MASISLHTKAATVAADYVGGGSFFMFPHAVGWVFTTNDDIH